MYRKIFIICFIFLSCEKKDDLLISGLWTNYRPTYGIDTLQISNNKICHSFVYRDSLRRIYSNIIEYKNFPGEIKYIPYKIMQGSKKENISEKIKYMIFEIAEKSLWTYQDSINYPDRNFLKINAYRNTWENSEFEKYYDKFYKKSDEKECINNDLFTVYNFQKDFSKIKLVTIPPKFVGGDSVIRKIFNVETNFNKNNWTRLEIPFIINCTGQIEVLTDSSYSDGLIYIQNLVNSKLKKMNNWEPAYCNYTKVKSKTFLTISIEDGNIDAIYKY